MGKKELESGPIGKGRPNAHPDGWKDRRDTLPAASDGKLYEGINGTPGPDKDDTGYRIGEAARNRK